MRDINLKESKEVSAGAWSYMAIAGTTLCIAGVAAMIAAIVLQAIPSSEDETITNN